MAKIGNVRKVSLAELKPYEKNAKVHGEKQVERIAASIERFGFISPVFIDENKNVIAGHGRARNIRWRVFIVEASSSQSSQSSD